MIFTLCHAGLHVSMRWSKRVSMWANLRSTKYKVRLRKFEGGTTANLGVGMLGDSAQPSYRHLHASRT